MKKETAKKFEKDKNQKDLYWFVGLFSLGFLLTGAFVSYFVYFAYDRQMEADTYMMALEKDGKIYQLGNLQESSFAFDDELYTLSAHYLAELVALSYGDYEISETDNPFFAGNIRNKNLNKYLDQQTKYANPKESYQSHTIYDRDRRQIFAHEYGMENEYVFWLRPDFPSDDAQRRRFDKREYLNLTRLLKNKLNVNLKLKTDEANKLLILSFEN